MTDNSDQLQVELCSRGVEALELQVWRTTRASQVSQRSWAQWWLWRSGCYEHRPTLNIHWRHDLLLAEHVCWAVDGILPRNSFIYMKLKTVKCVQIQNFNAFYQPNRSLPLKKCVNFPTSDCPTCYQSTWFTLKSWYSNPSEHWASNWDP